MKDNRTVNVPETTEPAEAEEKSAVTDLGKFKDVKALLEAYQALEAEFTRRSQKLKELEASKEREATAPQADLPERECEAQGGETHEERAENEQADAAIAAAPSAEATDSDGGGEVAVTLSGMSEQMKNAVIEEYLNAVFAKRGVPFVTGGGAVSAAKRTPRTMREAGALANRLFKNKEDK